MPLHASRLSLFGAKNAWLSTSAYEWVLVLAAQKEVYREKAASTDALVLAASERGDREGMRLLCLNARLACIQTG